MYDADCKKITENLKMIASAPKEILGRAEWGGCNLGAIGEKISY